MSILASESELAASPLPSDCFLVITSTCLPSVVVSAVDAFEMVGFETCSNFAFGCSQSLTRGPLGLGSGLTLKNPSDSGLLRVLDSLSTLSSLGAAVLDGRDCSISLVSRRPLSLSSFSEPK